MTKIKNTKKGMAKKTLSMSLVVAMLATSNVPVWAAEFSDGSDAAVATEAPATEAFSDNATETPIVEDNSEDMTSAKDVTEGARFDFSELKFTKNPSVGNSQKLFTGTIKDEDGNNITSGKLCFVWQEDGVDRTGNEKDAADIIKATMTLTSSDVGKQLSVRFYEKGKKDITIKTIDLGIVQANSFTNVKMSFDDGGAGYAYTGQATDAQKVPTTVTGLPTGIDKDDFDWSWSGCDGSKVGTVTVTGTLKAAKAEETGYAGTITGTYDIVKQKDLSSKWLEKDVTVNNKEAGEYTGSPIELDKDAVSVKIKDTDITLPVKKVETDGSSIGENGIEVTFDAAALNKTGNFDLSADPVIKFTDNKVNIKTRDLSKGTAKLNVTYKVADMKAGFHVNPSRITLTGADGKSITADKLGNKVSVSLKEDVAKYAAVGTYKEAIIIKSLDSTDPASVTNTVYADLVVTKKNFDASAAKFANGTTLGLETSADDAWKATSKVEYTGEDITFTEKQLGSFLPDGTSNESDSNSFTITYANNKNASVKGSVASITVAGKAGSDYEGCSKTFYFKINPADVTVTNDAKTTDVKTAVKDTVKGVEYVEGATAESYKDAIGLNITAKNDKTDLNKTEKTFTLVDGTDYDCAYEFVANNTGNDTADKLQPNDDPNTVGQYVKVTATLKNTNYDVAASQTSTINGVKVITKKNVVTAYVPVVAKTIAGADVTFDKTEYVYTGDSIKPVITVKSGNKTLKEGKDYTVKILNGINVGTATAIITATATSGYREGSEIRKEFQIVKAKAEDIAVEISYTKSGSKADIKYDGEAWDNSRTGLTYTVKLGKVDVSSQFKPTWGENINAGKTAGKLTLTPNTNGKKNFDGVKEVTFEIKGETVTGTLAVYDENGTKISNDYSSPYMGIKGYVEAQEYTGSPITFAKTKFTATKKLTAGKDYEITYIDNTSSGTAYVCVTGKGNYVGTASVTLEDGTKIDNIFEGTLYEFDIEGATFTAKNVTVSNGTYASGLVVKPNVTIVKGNKTLVEGVDYKIVIDDTEKAINATTEKNIRFSIKGLGEYNTVWFDKDATGKYLVYGIDKFDFKNANVTSDGKTVTVRNGNVVVPSTEYTSEIKDGKVTVTATEGNKNYTGTITTDVNDTFVGAPVISNVKVTGNKATVILSDEAEGASGYDYVISTSKDPSDKDARIDVVKNQVQTTANFKYVPQGTYYAYCHAWTRDENGKKVFGEWSNSYPFPVTAITPDTPEILSVKTKGSTITVTYKESANSTGYDVVLGKGSKKEHGETRPYQYGKYKKLNVKPGVCKAVFKNVPAGTYYAGVHSWNRTASENDNKVFSKWSNLETAKVK
ncbi:hypothetical protein DWZ49_17375 [Ruminococcus sp. AF33-11BH]|nr:hypothetical protein DWZ49_17375 [Ruminococcus sp. AF33-11BH]